MSVPKTSQVWRPRTRQRYLNKGTTSTGATHCLKCANRQWSASGRRRPQGGRVTPTWEDRPLSASPDHTSFSLTEWKTVELLYLNLKLTNIVKVKKKKKKKAVLEKQGVFFFMSCYWAGLTWTDRSTTKLLMGVFSSLTSMFWSFLTGLHWDETFTFYVCVCWTEAIFFQFFDCSLL